jgi:hypothetical protein
LRTSATAAAATAWTTATTTTQAWSAASAATHALTATLATSASWAGCWHATTSTNGCECSGTAATAGTRTHRATGPTSTTARSGNAVCSRRSGRRLIFLWLRVWLRCDQSINGNHRAQINIGGEAHAVRTNRNARGGDSDAHQLWHAINIRIPLGAPTAIAIACFHKEPNNTVSDWLGKTTAIGAFVGSHVTSAPQG